MSVSTIQQAQAQNYPWNNIYCNALSCNSSSVSGGVELKDGSFDLKLTSQSSVPLTAERNMIWDTKNADLKLVADSSGASSLTYLPGTHQLADLDSNQTLSNKQLVDTKTQFVDVGSGNKKGLFDMSGIADGTVSISWPDLNGKVMATTEGKQQIKDKALEAKSTTVYDASDITKLLNFKTSSQSAGTTFTIESQATTSQRFIVPTQGATSSPIMTDPVVTNQTLTGSLNATTFMRSAKFNMIDQKDNTKNVGLVSNASVGITAHRTVTFDILDGDPTIKLYGDLRVNAGDVNFSGSNLTFTTASPTTITIPSGTVTMVTLADNQTLTNKKLIADTTLIEDQVDTTKHMRFDLTSMTTGKEFVIVPQQSQDAKLVVPDFVGNTHNVLAATSLQVSQNTDFSTTVIAPVGARSFSISTQGTNLAAQAQATFGVQCSCVGTDQIILSLRDYNGLGIPVLSCGGVGAGSFNLRVNNASTSNALGGASMVINVVLCG